MKKCDLTLSLKLQSGCDGDTIKPIMYHQNNCEAGGKTSYIMLFVIYKLTIFLICNFPLLKDIFRINYKTYKSLLSI